MREAKKNMCRTLYSGEIVPILYVGQRNTQQADSATQQRENSLERLNIGDKVFGKYRGSYPFSGEVAAVWSATNMGGACQDLYVRLDKECDGYTDFIFVQTNDSRIGLEKDEWTYNEDGSPRSSLFAFLARVSHEKITESVRATGRRELQTLNEGK